MSINTLEKNETIVNTLFNEIEKIIINNKTKMAYQNNDPHENELIIHIQYSLVFH